MTSDQVRAWAPGRVNLIGDHTDYLGGLVLPMAIELGTEVSARRGGDRVQLTSADEDGIVDLPAAGADVAAVTPTWARYVAGTVAECATGQGLVGTVASTVPLGAGLSSSSALVTAVALALGAPHDDRLELARRCQRAEQRASGVPGGIMDQLCIAAAQPGSALLIDCSTEQYEAVPVPAEVDVVVLHGGERRALVGSPYAERRTACERAQELLGARLVRLTAGDVERLEDPMLRRRARHVVTENARVLAFVEALRRGAWPEAGAAMTASHASLRDDFEVSTERLDALVTSLLETPGVFGARLTGAGFGGCVVALTEPGAVPWATPVKPSAGATVTQPAAPTESHLHLTPRKR